MSRNAVGLLLLALAAGGCGSPPAGGAGRLLPGSGVGSRGPGGRGARGLPADRGDATQRLGRGHRRRRAGRGDADARLLRHAAAARAGARGPGHRLHQRPGVLLDPRPDGLRRPAACVRRGGTGAGRRPCVPGRGVQPGQRAVHRGPGVRRRSGRRHRGPHLRDRGAGGRRRRDHRGGPAGTALLVTSSYAESRPGPILDDGIVPGRQALAPVLEAMRAFGSSPATSATPSTPASTVPADFPLGHDLPEDGGDYDVVAPSPGADGVGEVEVCGSTVWPAGASEARLAVNAAGPSTSTPATSSCWPTPGSPRP